VRNAGTLAGLAALLVLAVVAASAAIRNDDLAAALAVTRGAHRAAASLAALAVFALAWLGWRQVPLRMGIAGALALTIALSAIGVVAGIEPPRWAAISNQTGGIALAALLAWLNGRSAARVALPRAALPLATLALAVAAVQALGGALLVTLWPGAPVAAFIFHAAGGLAAAVLLAALGLRYAAFAVLVPSLGAAAAVSALPGISQVLHALAAASLLAAAAHAHGRAAT
jgi:hypothetical protein